MLKSSIRLFAATSAATIALLAGGAGTALAQSKTPIKIGVLTERSGVLGEMGVHNDVGIGMAVKEINAAGGIMGRPVEVIMADDQSDPTQAVNEARRLVDREKVDVVYGPIGSQAVMAVQPIFTAAKITSIGVAGTTAFTPKVAPYGFSLLLSAEGQGTALVDFVVDQLKAKSVAVISDSGGQAKAAANAIKNHLNTRGVKLAGHEEYPSGSLDMTPQLLNLKRTNPDQLILFAQAGQDTGRVLKNLNELGWDITVSGNISVVTGYKTALPIAGPDAYKNVYGANFKVLGYCGGDAVGSLPYTKFAERVKAFDPVVFPKLSVSQVPYSYDSIYVLKAAIEGAKSTKGPDITAWLEKNAHTITGVQGQFSASKDSHFLLGPSAVTMMRDADKVRSDGLTRRYDC